MLRCKGNQLSRHKRTVAVPGRVGDRDSVDHPRHGPAGRRQHPHGSIRFADCRNRHCRRSSLSSDVLACRFPTATSPMLLSFVPVGPFCLSRQQSNSKTRPLRGYATYYMCNLTSGQGHLAHLGTSANAGTCRAQSGARRKPAATRVGQTIKMIFIPSR